jgi:ADP-heptose:LPS heptosyltransferase
MPPKEDFSTPPSPRTLRPESDWLLRLPPFLRFFLVRWYVRFRHGLTLLGFFLVDGLALTLVRRGDSGAVVIIRNNALGDYILFRNFLEAVRRHPAYRGKRVVFCGSVATREMAEAFDRPLIDEFIWMGGSSAGSGVFGRFRLLRKLKRLGADVTLSPVFWRGLELDSLVRATAAPLRIGWATPRSRKLWGEKTGWINWNPPLLQALGNRCYTKLIPSPSNSIFEFERNRVFFRAVLGDEPLPTRPELVPLPVETSDMPRPFALLLPGAGQLLREWPAEKFGEIARRLHEKYGWHIAIAGTARDAEKARRIQEVSGTVPAIFTGSLSVVQLIALMARAALVVANDSAGIHLAAALRRKGVAVSNTMSLISFHPYPREFEPTVRFVYPQALREAESFETFLSHIQTQPKIPISEVEVETVWMEIEALLASD